MSVWVYECMSVVCHSRVLLSTISNNRFAIALCFLASIVLIDLQSINTRPIVYETGINEWNMNWDRKMLRKDELRQNNGAVWQIWDRINECMSVWGYEKHPMHPTGHYPIHPIHPHTYYFNYNLMHRLYRPCIPEQHKW